MKKITKFIFMAFAAALALTACSPNDDHSFGDLNLTEDQISFNIVPGSEEFFFDYTISFDASDKFVCLYEVDFGYGGSVKGKATSTEDVKGSHKYIARAGTYTAVCTITLPNGVQFTQEKEVILENDNPDALDPDPLTGRESKTWVVDGYNVHLAEVKAALPNEPNINGFMGLGSPDPTNVQCNQGWWGAGAGDKSFESSGWTLYDTKYTFSADGKLTIETAGEGYGRKAFDGQNGFISTSIVGDDMLFPYTGGEYTFTKTDTELTISDNGYLIYYAGSQSYEILYLSETALCVRVTNTVENHVWVFILCPQGTETPPPPLEGNWVDIDSDENLWKDVNFTNTYYVARGDNWEVLPTQELTVNGTQYSINFPDATDLQWQNQLVFVTDNVSTIAAEKYDFRVTLNASNEIRQATVKLTQAINDDDDAVFIFAERVDLPAGKDFVLELVDMQGKDMDPVKLVFDFGGNPANTDVVIKDIILQTHRD